MRDFAKRFYASKAWHTCRAGFISQRISIDGGKCQRCHERLGYIVHHKEELTPNNITDPGITLNWNNLQYVCSQCHEEIHDRCTSKSRVMFDSDGNVIEKFRPPVKNF